LVFLPNQLKCGAVAAAQLVVKLAVAAATALAVFCGYQGQLL
jgi:hypothetical protein